eukprot:10364463-Lingulodinium_polyedra.AAC.1
MVLHVPALPAIKARLRDVQNHRLASRPGAVQIAVSERKMRTAGEALRRHTQREAELLQAVEEAQRA